MKRAERSSAINRTFVSQPRLFHVFKEQAVNSHRAAFDVGLRVFAVQNCRLRLIHLDLRRVVQKRVGGRRAHFDHSARKLRALQNLTDPLHSLVRWQRSARHVERALRVVAVVHVVHLLGQNVQADAQALVDGQRGSAASRLHVRILILHVVALLRLFIVWTSVQLAVVLLANMSGAGKAIVRSCHARYFGTCPSVA